MTNVHRMPPPGLLREWSGARSRGLAAEVSAMRAAIATSDEAIRKMTDAVAVLVGVVEGTAQRSRNASRVTAQAFVISNGGSLLSLVENLDALGAQLRDGATEADKIDMVATAAQFRILDQVRGSIARRLHDTFRSVGVEMK